MTLSLGPFSASGAWLRRTVPRPDAKIRRPDRAQIWLPRDRRVGTYGRQLGQTADAMIVLLRHLPDRANLAPEEREAIEAFEKMANDIANIKEKHKLQAVRP
jgi:hypothetical protein